MREGTNVITAYFVVTYALPMLGNRLFGDHIVSSYGIYPLTPSALILPPAIYGLFRILSRLNFTLLPSLRLATLRLIVRWAAGVYSRFRLLVGLTAIGVAVHNLSIGLNSYRYATESISELGSVMLFSGIILNALITVDLFYFMFARSSDTSQRRRLETIVLAVALVLLANGIASMFQALVASFFSLFPAAFRKVILVRTDRPRVRSAIHTAAALLVFFLMFASAWYTGQLIKVSSSVDVQTLLGDPGQVLGQVATEAPFYQSFSYYLTERFSSHYYSLLFTAQASRDELRAGATSVLEFPLRTLLFRLDYILGGVMGADRPETSSLMQLNYRLLTLDPTSDRVGSSPGLIAVFTYVFGFPLNVVLCALYLRWVAKKIAVLLTQRAPFTFSAVGLLLIVHYLGGLFQSPFDFLMLIDENVGNVLLLYALFVKQSERMSVRPQVLPSARRAAEYHMMNSVRRSTFEGRS